MKLFVSFDGDHIGRMVGRASLADNPEEVARIAQAIERGNRIWASWAESHGGRVINIGGDEGRLEIEADYLSELPGIREQYEGAVGSSCSVGVGTKLSEADRSVMAAKLQGGDRIQLYTEEVDEILAEAKEKSEAEKLQDEYLNPDSGLQKAAPAMNAGTNAGFAGASRSQPAAPQKMAEGSEHSENEVLQSEIANAPAPGAPAQAAAADYEQLFHQLAAAQKEEAPQKPTGVVDGVREQVVKVLQQVRGHAAELEQMKQSNPEMYQSVVSVVQAMIAMARGAMGDESQPEQGQPIEKAEKVGQCKWKLGERRCQRKVYADYCHDHLGHWANKIKPVEELEKGEDMGATDLALRHLHPKHQKGILSAKTPQAMSDYITANESAIANHVYGPGEDFLVCDQAASLLSDALKKKNIAHHGIVGFTRDDRAADPDAETDDMEENGQSHAWIRTADGVDLDPTKQGTRGGQIVSSWAPSDGQEPEGPPKPAKRINKAALEAGKTGRHQVKLPVGSQVDSGPSAAHEGGEIKIQDPATGKTKWRQVRAGLVMAPDGTPTSSRNPGG